MDAMDIVISFAVAVAVHEFSHALCCLLLGVKIEKMEIGYPSIVELRGSKFSFFIGPLPIGGMVGIRDDDISRWKLMIIVAAGPLSNIVMLFNGVAIVGNVYVLLASIGGDFKMMLDIVKGKEVRRKK